MAKSEEFKRELKAGNFTQALQLALTEAIELKITTWVSSDQDMAEGAEPRVGHRMRTRINIVDGDIDNEIGSQFLSSGPYAELQQFHLGQVAQGRQIVHQNLQSLRELFSVLIGGVRGQLSPAQPPTPLETGMGQLTPAGYSGSYVNYDSVPATIDTVAQASSPQNLHEPSPQNLIDLDLDETTLTAPGPDETATVNEFGDLGAFGDQAFGDPTTVAQTRSGSDPMGSDLSFSDVGFDPNWAAQPQAPDQSDQYQPDQSVPDFESEFEAEFDPNMPATQSPATESPMMTSPGFDTFGSEMTDDPFPSPEDVQSPSADEAGLENADPNFAEAETAFGDLDFNPSFDQKVSRRIDQPNPIQPDNFFEDLAMPADDSADEADDAFSDPSLAQAAEDAPFEDASFEDEPFEESPLEESPFEDFSFSDEPSDEFSEVSDDVSNSLPDDSFETSLAQLNQPETESQFSEPSAGSEFSQPSQAEPELTPWELEDSETLTMPPEALTGDPNLQRSASTSQPMSESDLEDELSSFFGDQIPDDEPTAIAPAPPPTQQPSSEPSSEQADFQDFADLEAAFDLGTDGFDPNETDPEPSGSKSFTAEDFGSDLEADALSGNGGWNPEEFTSESPTTELMPQSAQTLTRAQPQSQPPISSVDEAVAALFGDSSTLEPPPSNPASSSSEGGEFSEFDEASLNALFGEGEALDEAYLFPSVPDMPDEPDQDRSANQNQNEDYGGFADFPDEETAF